MSVKAKVEAIIYATEEPVTLNQLASLLRDEVLGEFRAADEARLALNETVSDGKPESDDNDDSSSRCVATEEAADLAISAAPSGETAVAEGSTDERQKDADKEQNKQIKAYLSKVLEELA